MNPTEKLSDAELLIANARARTRALKYEYLTAEEQLWRDLAAYLEKAIADLTARNDTIARVGEIAKMLIGCGNASWRASDIGNKLTKALTPTQPEVTACAHIRHEDVRSCNQPALAGHAYCKYHIHEELDAAQPEASEPAATAVERHCRWHSDYSISCECDCQICTDAKAKPVAPPDSPERCAHHVVEWNTESELWFCVHCKAWAKTADNWHFDWQPPPAPPETRDAARERLERGAVYALRNAVMRNISHQADGKEFTLAIDALANYIEARAAAAGGKRTTRPS